MENYLVSIIIPVYNVENYLHDCILSVLNQTYRDIEVWLVDDGSNDSSGEICDYYSTIDKRINVIHKENGGLSSARNAALDQAKGCYIYFLDSDDLIEKDLIYNLMQVMLKNNNVDAVIGNFTEFIDGKIILKDNKTFTYEIINNISCLKMMFLDSKITHSSCGKIYKKHLFNNIRFPEGMLYEDYATTYYLISICNYIGVTDDKSYYYRVRKNSIMNSSVTEKDMVLLDIAIKVQNDISILYPELEEYAIRETAINYIKLYYRILCTGFESFNREQMRILKFINNNYRQLMKSKYIVKKDKIKIFFAKNSKIFFYLICSIKDYIYYFTKISKINRY